VCVADNDNHLPSPGKSDEILGFDCGGQQWVLEMAFPTGTLAEPTYADIAFVMELKQRLEAASVGTARQSLDFHHVPARPSPHAWYSPCMLGTPRRAPTSFPYSPARA